MSIAKLATLMVLPESLLFLFPFVFSDELITEAITSIRTGGDRDWKREFTKSQVVVNIGSNFALGSEHKYIVFYDRNFLKPDRHMVVFPKKIDHDRMWEYLRMVILQTDFPNGQDPGNIFSAGFTSGGECYGRSETLKVKSDKGDTALFKNTFIK